MKTIFILFVMIISSFSVMAANCGASGCIVCERLQCYQTSQIYSSGWPPYTTTTYYIQCNDGHSASYTAQTCQATVGSSSSSDRCSGNRECWCDYNPCRSNSGVTGTCYSTCPSAAEMCSSSLTVTSSNYSQNIAIYNSSMHISYSPPALVCGSTTTSIMIENGQSCPAGYFGVCSGQYVPGTNSAGTVYYSCQ